MAETNWGNVYTRLGVRPVINAVGNQTVLGGSTPSPLVRQAMDEASMSFVEMKNAAPRTDFGSCQSPRTETEEVNHENPKH